MDSQKNIGVYFGTRGDRFKEFIKSLLYLGKIKNSYIEILTNEICMKEYEKAFTSEQIDEKNNYQFYEQIGDVAANKFIVYYMYKRFPQLKCYDGVKVAARVKINYCSKESFANIAEKYNFWEYITAPQILRENNKKDLLEDVFEAFIGVTEYLIDDNIKYEEKNIYGIGYASIYKILKAIFDNIEINIKHEELYDAKTRLKEVFDLYREKLGEIKYETSIIMTNDSYETICNIYRLDGIKYESLPDGKINFKKYSGTPIKVHLATSKAKYKDHAEQLASSIAIKFLESQGYIKYPPSIYAQLAGEKKITKENLLSITKSKNLHEAQLKINTPIVQKGNTKYSATPIFIFSKKRDFDGIKECIENGADLSLQDCYGLSIFDRILLGDIDHEFIKKILKIFSSPKKANLSIPQNKLKDKIKISKNIFENYKNEYNLQKSRFIFI